ncbi:hypothetical protein PCANC_21896 [Puccinia coronata f. sp. avenae]|uniref:Uncharacterized protein n=1 Tax=Puccinia coronata f. sp. avenae TaxID=200324 RepID=A0A2N5U7W1_9BASI|nr:hypothetical protein PCANC_21896 [Puccinia coronata f. sp. avenae]
MGAPPLDVLKYYNIWIQTNAFANHVIKNDESYVTNISIYRNDVVKHCKATVAKFGEIAFVDNPYAPGGPRANWDPITREPHPTKNKVNNPSNNNPSNHNSSNNNSSNNNNDSTNKGGSFNGGGGRRGRGGWSNNQGQRDSYGGGHSGNRDGGNRGRDLNDK